jgi:enamine deaminase RidA (YjgF/YER057c/UK114 family)
LSDHLEYVDYEDPVEYGMPFTPAIKVKSGKLVFCSGTAAAPPYHHHPHRAEEFENIPEGAAEQAHVAMGNLKRSLEGAGATFDDVVWINRFFTDITNDGDIINKVCGEYFGANRPASTNVGVTGLVFPGLRFEINAIAVVRDE